MKDLIRACGAAAGVQWARSASLTQETQDLLSALDRAFAADEWDYPRIYADLVPPRSGDRHEESALTAVAKRKAAAELWWGEIAGVGWPDSEVDRIVFVRAFVIAAACELRNSQFS